MARRTGSGGGGSTPAVAAARRAGIPHAVHRYDVAERQEEGYGAEAAARLGLDPAVVHKTLVTATAPGRLAVAVVPVSGQLDLRALARALGARRAHLADPAEAARVTGYVLGGISPLGQRTALTTVVDEGALAHPTIFVSAGRRGLEIELDPHDLVRLTGATVAAIAG